MPRWRPPFVRCCARRARAWQLAPIGRTSLIAGKLLAGWLTAVLVGLIVLALGAVGGHIRPRGGYWLSTLGMMLLIALASAGLGVALGAALRGIQRVTALGILLSLYLFFLSGGIAVAAFLPAWVQAIAHVIPTYYGVHALQTAIFYHSSGQLGRDVAVMGGTAAATWRSAWSRCAGAPSA